MEEHKRSDKMSKTLTTKDIREWLKSLLPNDAFARYYCNLLDKNNSINNQLGIYYTKDKLQHLVIDMGGNIDRRKEGFTILIRGSDNYEESRELAILVASTIYKQYIENINLEINNIPIYTIDFLTDVVDVSDYEKENVYEFVINIVVCYKYTL